MRPCHFTTKVYIFVFSFYIYIFFIYMRVCVYNHTIQQRMFSGGPIGCHIFVNFFESSFFCPGNVTASAGVGKGRVVFFLTFWHLQKITNCHCWQRIQGSRVVVTGELPTALPLPPKRLLLM